MSRTRCRDVGLGSGRQQVTERGEEVVFNEGKGAVFVCVIEAGRSALIHIDVFGGGRWRGIEPYCSVAMAGNDGYLVCVVDC